MTFFIGDFTATQAALDQSLALGQQTEERSAIAWSLALQSAIGVAKGDFAAAREYAVRRRDPVAGDVVVHFPRQGFALTA